MSKRFNSLSAIVLAVGGLMVGQPFKAQAQVFNPPTPQPNQATQPVTAPQFGVQQAVGSTAPAQVEPVKQTAWGIPMPKLTMPKLTMPKLTMPDISSVTAPVKSGFDKVSSGSKKAWEGTKEMFSMGQSSSAPATRAPAQQKTSFWQRLTAKPEPQGPQTVGEFMRQPRLDP